jgi:hypothetical protein
MLGKFSYPNILRFFFLSFYRFALIDITRARVCVCVRAD